MKLNDKQENFCQEYVKDFNGKQSYMKAYPNAKEKSAEALASNLLSNIKVQERLAELKGELKERNIVTREKLVEDLIAIKDLCFTDKRAVHNSIKAIESISKLLGLNEPDKIDIKAEIENKTLRDYLEFDE